jgi:hypothetical protein
MTTAKTHEEQTAASTSSSICPSILAKILTTPAKRRSHDGAFILAAFVSIDKLSH